MKTMRNLLVSALVAALALVPSAATAGERLMAEPGDHSGTYHATIDFVMAGAWNLILRFTKPHRDQLVLTDDVLMQAGGKGQEPMRMEQGTGQMKHDPGKMKQMN